MNITLCMRLVNRWAKADVKRDNEITGPKLFFFVLFDGKDRYALQNGPYNREIRIRGPYNLK